MYDDFEPLYFLDFSEEWYFESIETAFEIANFIIQSFENYELNN